MKLERIGIGLEHRVYRPANNPGYVLKKPRLWTLWEINRSGGPAQLEQEQAALKKLTVGTSIKTPKTQTIFITGLDGRGGYIIKQEYIEPDKSVTDIGRLLKGESEQLYRLYRLKKENFIPHDGHIYLVDLTTGLGSRVSERIRVSGLGKKLMRQSSNFAPNT